MIRIDNKYTITETTDIPGGGKLSRTFNFAAEQVTSILIVRAEKEDHREIRAYSSDGGTGIATSVSVAITSQMQTQRFSDFDSLAEIEMMKALLLKNDGVIPNNAQKLAKSSGKLSAGGS